MMLFGRQVRDAIPAVIGNYIPHQTWTDLQDHREKALCKRMVLEHEKWSAHTRPLPPLKVGDTVFVQNQSGNHPRRFERTGIIVEVLQHDQYQVRMDGSGRISLRNRKFLRKFTPTPRANPAIPASPASLPKPVHMPAKPTSPITPPTTPAPTVPLTPPNQQAGSPEHPQRTLARNQTPEQWAASPTFVPRPAASPSPSPFHGFPSPR